MKAKYSAYTQTKELQYSGKDGSSPPPGSASIQKRLYITFPIVFIVALSMAAGFGKVPPIIPPAYLIISLLTFIEYVIDKKKAETGKRRIPELSLHLWELFGGWPGAMLAQALIKHKNAKFSYQIVFWLAILINLAVLFSILYFIAKSSK